MLDISVYTAESLVVHQDPWILVGLEATMFPNRSRRLMKKGLFKHITKLIILSVTMVIRKCP